MFKPSWILTGITAVGLFAGNAMAQDPKLMPAAPAPAAPAPVVVGCDSGCCTSGCTTGCCTTGCDNGCESGQGHIIADIGFLILTPYWKTNPALYIQNPNLTTTNVGIDDKDFGQPAQFVPQISLGYVGASGLGARIGWWGFATSKTVLQSGTDPSGNDLFITSATPLGVSIANGTRGESDGGAVEASYRLRMDVWDFEALHTYESGNTSLLVSGGFRYAHIGMDYNAAQFTGRDIDFTPGSLHNFILSGNNFNGAGFTGAAEVRTGRTLYATTSIRGSLLFGQGSQHATWARLVSEGGIVNVADEQSNYNEVLPVLEFKAGIGIKGDESRRIVPFLELGFDAQAWFDLGNPSRSTVGYTENSSPSAFGGGPNFTGSTGDPTLGLFGFYLQGGLTF